MDSAVSVLGLYIAVHEVFQMTGLSCPETCCGSQIGSFMILGSRRFQRAADTEHHVYQRDRQCLLHRRDSPCKQQNYAQAQPEARESQQDQEGRIQASRGDAPSPGLIANLLPCIMHNAAARQGAV